MRLSGRVTQYLIDMFEDNRGVDCERLYRFLTDAHLKSGQLLDSNTISNENKRMWKVVRTRIIELLVVDQTIGSSMLKLD